MATRTNNRSPLERATVRLRQGSDRERAFYVTMRKALTPRTTLVRSRTARDSAADRPFEMPWDRGFAIFPPGRFPEADEVVREANEQLASVDVESLSRKGKQFMLPIFDQKALTRESALLRLTLREDILRAVADYLGTAPLLTNVNVYLSRSTDREFISSQLFHCDGDDTKQVKLFVLCSEVTQANGPLMVLNATESERLRREVGYKYKDRVSDEVAERVLGEPPMDAVEGPPGTVALVDTSRCFHYGSRVGAEAEPRLAAMIQFLTPHSFMLPRDVSAGAPFPGLIQRDDSELVRLALGG